MWIRSGIVACGALAVLAALPARAQDTLRTYETKYYTLRTDLDADRLREITQHLTLMAEEYNRRTRGFAGTVNRRLPVYAFRDARGYLANGGMSGSGGVFTGDKLMVMAGEEITPWTWHVIQHEGFHQFALAAIGRGLPIWANEGLAEYFGHGVFTGDGFYTGLIPPQRQARVQSGIREGKFRSLKSMMLLPHEVWNAEVGLARQQASFNYDQAWSMIHFLAHADGGRYQDAFASFLRGVSHGQPWEQAWVRSFGNGVDAFQQRWEAYWLGLPESPTEQLYAEATAATLTSFFARAFSQRQYFESFEEFAEAGKAGELKMHTEDWLPSSLLTDALKVAPTMGTWSIDSKPGRRLVVCTRADGTTIEGRFRVASRRVKGVDVAVRPPKKKRK